ncbi:MAG TPA: malto-oligosyltrehalose trehalohydrolase [Geminicoccaceae bacterium]|nr:malto-oligosyltrehalose trehalohydrolase [Geminicoccaceae bacterium]
MKAGHDMPFGAALRDDGRVRFRLWAPDLEELRLALEDRGETLPMQPVGGGWFELVTDRAGAGSRYRYLLPDGLAVPDPASRGQAGGVHGASLVVDPGRYAWRHADWRGRPWHEAVVLELHLGTFSPEGTFRGAISKLAHLRSLGVTAIEIMPIAAFGGARNWGYDGVLLYAPADCYGTPDDLKALIDAAHGEGLMVLLDVVYNHFGPDGNFLPRYAGAFFNPGEPTPGGPAIDYRRPEVRDFAIHNALYWLEEYRFDGLRLDAVHAIQDPGEPHLLDELAARVRETLGAERHVHLILENDANEARRLARAVGGADRYDAQWNDDWHHCAHVLLTREGEGYYAPYTERPHAMLARSLAEGFVYQGEVSPNHGGPRGEPSAGLAPTAFIDFLQNHDQIGNRAMGERLAALAEPRALEALTALLLLSPQVPMLFMGEEWGTERPFLFFTDFEGELRDAVREGRRKEFARFPAFADPERRARIPDPNDPATFARSRLDWNEPELPAHAARLALVRRLLALRHEFLVPRLAATEGHAGEATAPGDGTVRAGWRLGDGSRLLVLANLGDGAATGLERPDAELLVAVPGEADAALARGGLPPWSVVWFLAPAEDAA